MDEIVLRAMEKWPSVPPAFGWLSLDARGQWRIKGERITNSLLQEFIERNYGHDDTGRWFFQNGPQRVFVTLAYAPWVVRLDSEAFVTHTRQSIGALDGAWIDEEGVIVLSTNLGPATVDDRDMDLVCSRFIDAGGMPPAEDLLIELVDLTVAGHDCGLYLPYRSRTVTVQPIRRAHVATRFGFVREPSPEADTVARDASVA